VGVQNLHINKYIQLFLKHGKYSLTLSHDDVFTFSDTYTYTLKVTDKAMFFNIYNGLMSKNFGVKYKEPKNFKNKFMPASSQR